MTNDGDQANTIAKAICAGLSLGGDVERFPSGSVPVYAVGADHVIKLFPLEERSFFETERAALARVGGALSIPTPQLIETGEREGWLFIAMTRLRGISLAQAWPVIDAEERSRLVRAVGLGLAELHALATDHLSPLVVDWAQFMADQRASCRERQLAKQLGSPWVDLVDDFLARWTPADDGRRVLLHTEVMREHLLVEQRGGAWCLSGLVDFEPATLGAPEYELAAVGVFLTCGEAGLLRVFLDGYGVQPDESLPQRMLAYALLHKYSNLRWYMERLPIGDADDLESLARRWFTP